MGAVLYGRPAAGRGTLAGRLAVAEPSLQHQDAGGAAPHEITLASSQEIQLESVVAVWDGAAASATFKPCLSIYSQDGVLLSRTFPDTSMNTGDSGVVTYAPFLGGEGGGNVGGGGTTLIYDYTVAGAAKASIDTALDGSLAGPLRTDLTYLEIYLVGRTDEANFVSDVSVFFNNDTAAGSYDRIAIASSSGGTPIQVQAIAGSTSAGVIAGGSAAASVAGLMRLFMPNYSDPTFFKVLEFTAWSGDTVLGLTHYQIGLESVLWESANKVDRIMMTPVNAGVKFAVGTRLSVWAR